MNFKPDEKNIRSLLKSSCQFIIPRFQREYSWDKKNYQEFFEDMINNLVVDEGNIKDDQYFLGTMLFVGNFTEKPDKPIEVIDGQQRLTTITILFSVLSDRFRELGEDTLSKQLFNYIMTTDDDGNEVRVLQSKSSYPYFVYYIQDREKTIDALPNTEEENCIQETYEYFLQQTSENALKKLLKKRMGDDIVQSFSHLEILKALRDQVLGCTFISIAAADKDQANKIFAILNAKGKRLAYIDLIKNKIFEELKDGVDGTFAEESWDEIKKLLNSGAETIGMATFFRHYWISKYRRCNASVLYDNFNKTIAKKKETYKEFLRDLVNNAKNYVKIINPNRADYNNRKEYFWLVQSLSTMNKTFNVVQTRIALLALYDVKERNLISTAQFKKAIITMENFHFAFTAICSMRTNNLEAIYSRFAIDLRKCTNKQETSKVIEERLITPLEKLYPKYNSFKAGFGELIYSKKDLPINVKTKYAVYKLNCYFSSKEIFEDDGSIEHIVSETAGENALNIGNLILLEQELNREAGERDYLGKVYYYKKSNYDWIQKFIKENDAWSEEKIRDRAEKLADIYYKDILKRKVSEGKVQSAKA
jgi:uncharacterized protein with ParB-like and HNH nuclease domain